LFADGTEAGQDFSMKIRAGLDLYANVRPIYLYPGVKTPLAGQQPGGIDFVIVRENTEGLYAARGGGNLLGNEVATDTMVLTRTGTARITEMAAKICLQRNGAPADGKRRVTIVDKANVLRSYAFFRQVADEVLAKYPEIEVEHIIVDAMTVHMLNRPGHFDVVVCENLLGDILSDLGAAMIGGLGVAPSGEMSTTHGYFQGSHGSAPDISGKGIANPTATILSTAMMLDWLAQKKSNPNLATAAGRIRSAVEGVLAAATCLTPDLGGEASADQFTDAIIGRL
jgi:3-isopropylmalate dehydrogenase